MQQTLSQFMWYQRRRVAGLKYVPVRVTDRLDLLDEDRYVGSVVLDDDLEFQYKRGLVIAGEGV